MSYGIALISLLVGFFVTNSWAAADRNSKNLSDWYALAKANNGKVSTIEPLKAAAISSRGIPTYLNETAIAYLNLGDINKAKQLLQQSISSDPRSFDAHNYLAYVYELQKNYKNAIVQRQLVMKLDPVNLDNMLGLIIYFTKSEEISKANAILLEMVKIDPNSKQVAKARTLIPTK